GIRDDLVTGVQTCALPILQRAGLGRAQERRPVPGDDALELVPVRLAVFPDAVVALAQLRVGNREAELEDLRHVAVEELLPRLLVDRKSDGSGAAEDGG